KIAAHPITKKDLAGFIDVDRTFAENEHLRLAGKPGWSLRIYHTPGHARGHVCIFEEGHGSLITGDLMAGIGTIVIDPPEGHMATYFDLLRRMQALPVRARAGEGRCEVEDSGVPRSSVDEGEEDPGGLAAGGAAFEGHCVGGLYGC